MSTYRPLCRAEEIAEGEAKMFVLDGRRVAVFHVGERFYAIDDECPHAGASLARGMIEGHSVSCRIHHWRFCLKNGRYLDDNRPQCDVATYPVRVVGGELEVALG